LGAESTFVGTAFVDGAFTAATSDVLCGNVYASGAVSVRNIGTTLECSTQAAAYTTFDMDTYRRLEIDQRRSLAVTEETILESFGLERALNQLVKQADVENMTAANLFAQWWDTQNRYPGILDQAGPFCDDNDGTINGFPNDCRPYPIEEGKQALCNPFTSKECEYLPTGLFMRFDLAPVDGAHCGEYRILYAKKSIATRDHNASRDRNTLIFEAYLPNPKPKRGIEGCRNIVAGWAALSKETDIDKRKAWLERFYFEGHRKVQPVVSVTHFGDNDLGAGQIRTNQFIQAKNEGRKWSLREFKLMKECTDGACELKMIPVTVKGNPYGPLFDPKSTHPNAGFFQQAFIDNAVETLAADSLGGISMNLSDEFNSPQSHSSGSNENNYVVNFGESHNAGGFSDKIQDKLTKLGSDLTPVNIVTRAMTQSCAGCHRLNIERKGFADLGGNLTWPAPLAFTHVDERSLETVDQVRRYEISPFLTSEFLPLRENVMRDYLNDLQRKGKHKGKHKVKNMGGSSTHYKQRFPQVNRAPQAIAPALFFWVDHAETC
jgi:hypothetical protein